MKEQCEHDPTSEDMHTRVSVCLHVRDGLASRGDPHGPPAWFNGFADAVLKFLITFGQGVCIFILHWVPIGSVAGPGARGWLGDGSPRSSLCVGVPGDPLSSLRVALFTVTR